MKATVDANRCQGHTLCAMNAPDFFVLDPLDGHASVVSEDVPEDQTEQVAQAYASCPEQAIALRD